MSKNRKVYWEDYATNYIIPLSSEDAEEEHDRVIDKMDEENSFMDDIPEKLIKSAPSQIYDMKNYVYSPWGAISRNDPFSPIVFYPDMKVMHTKGFSLHLYSGDASFEDTLDSVDGIAAWKSLNPYCFIVAKAKAYEWSEVIDSVHLAFGVTGGAQKSTDTIKKIIAELSASDDFKLKTYVITNGDIQSSKIGDEDYDSFVEFALTLATDGANEKTTVIHEGNIICQT